MFIACYPDRHRSSLIVCNDSRSRPRSELSVRRIENLNRPARVQLYVNRSNTPNGVVGGRDDLPCPDSFQSSIAIEFGSVEILDDSIAKLT